MSRYVRNGGNVKFINWPISLQLSASMEMQLFHSTIYHVVHCFVCNWLHETSISSFGLENKNADFDRTAGKFLNFKSATVLKCSCLYILVISRVSKFCGGPKPSSFRLSL